MLDNKALPTTNKPVNIFLILLKINAFPIWYLMWKERKTSSAKGGIELTATHFTTYAIGAVFSSRLL